MTSGLKSIILLFACLLFSTSFLLAQDAPKNMSINVIDPGTGGGLEGAKIDWQSYGETGGQNKGSAITDSDGLATIPLPAKGSQYFRFGITHAGFVGLRAMWPAQNFGGAGDNAGTREPPTSYEVTMEPTHAISGKVVDENGQPVSGATIVMTLNKKINTPNTSLDISWKNIKTTPEGTFKFEGGPSTIDAAELGYFHPDYNNSAYGFYNMSKYETPQKLIDGSAVFTLAHGVPVEGTVTGPDEKPIAGAKIGWGQDRVASNVLPEQSTDSQGHFHFGSQPNITATITVKAKGLAPDLKTVNVTNEKTTVDFQLKLGKTLAGKITLPEGKSVTSGNVYIDTWRGARTLNQSIKINADGTFIWKDAPEDEVLADILVRGVAPKRRVPMKPGDQPIAVSLMDGVSVHGKVVDAETGKPIEHFRVIQGILFEQQRAPSWQSRQGTVGENGEFTMKLSEPYPMYLVRIEADGYKRADSRSFKQDEQKVELEFKLVKGKSIVGVVKDPTGQPIAGAKVIAATPSQSLYIQNDFDTRRGNDNVVTDESGKYTLPEQNETYKLLVVADQGYAIVTEKEIEASPDIQIKPWAKIEGTFINNSKPAADEQIMVSMLGGGDDKTPQIGFSFNLKTDSDGHFETSKVPAGEFWVSRTVPMNTGQYSMSINTHSDRVIVESGKTATVQLGGKGRPVIGKLNLPNEKLNGRTWVQSFCTIASRQPPEIEAIVEKTKGFDEKQSREWYEKWKDSDEAKKYNLAMEEYQKHVTRFEVLINKDGTFRAECVTTGKYELTLGLGETSNNQPFGGKQIASLRKMLEVPEIPSGHSEEPVDLGTNDLDWIAPK